MHSIDPVDSRTRQRHPTHWCRHQSRPSLSLSTNTRAHNTCLDKTVKAAEPRRRLLSRSATSSLGRNSGVPVPPTPAQYQRYCPRCRRCHRRRHHQPDANGAVVHTTPSGCLRFVALRLLFSDPATDPVSRLSLKSSMARVRRESGDAPSPSRRHGCCRRIVGPGQQGQPPRPRHHSAAPRSSRSHPTCNHTAYTRAGRRQHTVTQSLKHANQQQRQCESP